MGFKQRQNARDGAQSTHPFPDDIKTLGELVASGKAEEWLRGLPEYQDWQRKALAFQQMFEKMFEKMFEPIRQRLIRLQEIFDRPENEIWWHVNTTDPQMWRMLRTLRSYLEKNRNMTSEEALAHIVVMTQDERALRDGASDRDVAIMDMVEKHGRELVCKVLELTRKQLRNIILRARMKRSPPPVPNEEMPRPE